MTANTKEPESVAGPVDTAKLVLASAALVGGVVAYYWFEEASILLRVLAVVAGLALAAALVFWTRQGQQLWQFIQGSQVEIRKVIWPTRQETQQTTLMVVVFVLVFGIFFWLLDMVLLFITRAITGQGG